MEGIYITIAETMGTDGEFSSEVYLSQTEQEAGETACSLVADMAITMGVYDTNPDFDATSTWSIEGEGWWYRVRTEKQGFFHL